MLNAADISFVHLGIEIEHLRDSRPVSQALSGLLVLISAGILIKKHTKWKSLIKH